MSTEIPTELVVKAAKASSQHFEHCDQGKSWTDCGDCVRAYDRAHYALAAVLPKHEAQLRADAANAEVERLRAEVADEQQRADDRRTELLEERDLALHDLAEANATITRVRDRLDVLDGVAQGLGEIYGHAAERPVRAFLESLRRALDASGGTESEDDSAIRDKFGREVFPESTEDGGE